MENLQVSDNLEVASPKKGRGQYERKARGNYQKHKLEKKITVKHFVNTKIDFYKSNKSLRGTQPDVIMELFKVEKHFRHPLYVRISFDGSMNFIRSRTEESFTEKYTFEDAMKNESFSRALEREIYIIEKFIRENNEQKDEIRGVLADYTFEACLLERVVNNALFIEIFNFFKKNYPNDNPDAEFYEGISCEDEELENYLDILDYALTVHKMTAPSPLEVLTYLEKKDRKFSELRVIFPSDVWQLRCYHITPPDLDPNITDEEGYEYLFPTGVDFTDGKFREYFLKYNKFDLPEVQMILNDLDKLVERGTFLNFRYF